MTIEKICQNFIVHSAIALTDSTWVCECEVDNRGRLLTMNTIYGLKV